MGRRIVVDGSTVVGVVGSRYEAYPHLRLVGIVNEMLRGLGWNQELDGVARGWAATGRQTEVGLAIGTELRINLPLQEYEHPTQIEGAGGPGSDVSWVGVELRNGLSGERAVGIRTLVVRLVCANGMRMPASDRKHRIRHVGGGERLDSELKRILGTAQDNLGSAIMQLESLGNRVFDPEALYKDPESIKLVRQILEDVPNGRPWVRRIASARTNGHSGNVIDEMAHHLAGPLSGAVWRSAYRSNATWWDFVNIFTEAAHSCGSLDERLRIEERSGRLADRWGKPEVRA